MSDTNSDFLYFVSRLDSILTCVACVQLYTDPKERSCGHVFCAECHPTGNGADCDQCGTDNMEGQNTKHFHELRTLYDNMKNLSVSDYHQCRRCGKSTSISQLWVCTDCGVTVECSECVIGKCSHGNGENPVRSVESILAQTKADTDRWRQDFFVVEMNTLSQRVNQLAGKVDLVSSRVAEVPSLNNWSVVHGSIDIFGQQINGIKFAISLLKQQEKYLTTCLEDMAGLLQLFPALTIISDTVAQIERGCAEIGAKIDSVVGNFHLWLEHCRGYGNAELVAACQLEDNDGGQPEAQ